jgi:nucleotide-binding universal stress UspA family protein
MKTILAHLSDAKRAPQVLAAAARLAAVFDAHLVGLHVVPAPYVPIAPYGDATGEIIEIESRALEAQAEAIVSLFNGSDAGRGGRSEMRRIEAHLGPVADIVTLHARTADLAVLAQPEPGIRFDYRPTDIAEDVMIGSGRPVLLVPERGADGIVGGRVVIAWNGSREASRAVFDALPVLVRAREVRVITIETVRPPGGERGEEARDIAAALVRQGVKAVTATALVRRNASIADEIMARVKELGGDLLVMGGYGHARLREAIFGGATIDVLARMAVPVLMSH